MALLPVAQKLTRHTRHPTEAPNPAPINIVGAAERTGSGTDVTEVDEFVRADEDDRRVGAG
jgi:hypothetical protein